EARHLRHPELGVGLAAEEGAARAGDLLGLEAGGGDLVQERLEQVVVVAIHQHDVDGRLPQRPSGAQAAESGTDDDDGGSAGARGQGGRRSVAAHGAGRRGGRDVGHGSLADQTDSDSIPIGVPGSAVSVSRTELSPLSRTIESKSAAVARWSFDLQSVKNMRPPTGKIARNGCRLAWSAGE